jgi:hypothetical protein
MNTVGTLEAQHREVEKLFFRIANTSDSGTRTMLFKELTDRLVDYAAIESQTDERVIHGYVGARQGRPDQNMRHSRL